MVFQVWRVRSKKWPRLAALQLWWHEQAVTNNATKTVTVSLQGMHVLSFMLPFIIVDVFGVTRAFIFSMFAYNEQ